MSCEFLTACTCLSGAAWMMPPGGVVGHDEVTVPRISASGRDGKDKAVRPLDLQDHGNPVRDRNIWVVPKP